ncbi:hypothetical protein M3Y94_01251800 [Aphelenchoides besseyi]|nr:hypothetical protein M3Y94_01251800 [Aphelenchoides besseyi]KAI6219416.1 hypothetical protein M3Y95_01108800 [Aphelenchoides besseyi]
MNTSILGLLLLLVAQVADTHDAITSSGRLACGMTKICSEVDRIIWRKLQQKVRDLLKLQTFVRDNEDAYFDDTIGNMTAEEREEFLHRRSKLYDLRTEFCPNDQTTGFLLNNTSDSWPMACVWTASNVNGSCIPAWPSDSKFHYIDKDEWQTAVKTFRKKIGCWSIEGPSEIDELYVCRHRCTEGGIGYMSSLFIMANLILAVGTLIS